MWQNYTFPRFLNEKLQKKFFMTTLTVKFLYTTVKKFYTFCKTLFFLFYWFLIVYNFGTAIAMLKGSKIINQ